MTGREKPAAGRPGRAGVPISSWTLARALRTFPPRSVQGLRAFLVNHWRGVLVMAGAVVQVVLTVMMWQLVDLCIALMEVWAELARKHLELVLS